MLLILKQCHIDITPPCNYCDRYKRQCVPVNNTNALWQPPGYNGPHPIEYTGSINPSVHALPPANPGQSHTAFPTPAQTRRTSQGSQLSRSASGMSVLNTQGSPVQASPQGRPASQSSAPGRPLSQTSAQGQSRPQQTPSKGRPASQGSLQGWLAKQGSPASQASPQGRPPSQASPQSQGSPQIRPISQGSVPGRPVSQGSPASRSLPQGQVLPQSDVDAAIGGSVASEKDLPLEAIRNNPTIALNRPAYCYRACKPQYPSVQLVELRRGDIAQVLSAAVDPDTNEVWCHLELSSTKQRAIAPITHLRINGSKKWDQWDTVLKISGRPKRGPVDAQRPGSKSKFYRAMLCNIEEFHNRWQDLNLASDKREAINTPEKRTTLADRILQGCYRANTGEFLEKKDLFTVQELFSVARIGATDRNSGIYANLYDQAFRIGKAAVIADRIADHIKNGDPVLSGLAKKERTHYDKAQKAKNKRHVTIAHLDGALIKHFAEQIFVNLFGTAANKLTGFTVQSNSAQDATDKANKTVSWVQLCKDAILMEEIVNKVYTTTGWVPLTKRTNSGVNEGLNMAMPLLENPGANRIVWCCYDSGGDELRFRMYPRRIYDDTLAFWTFYITSLQKVSWSRVRNSDITADTKVFPIVKMTKSGDPVQYPWANIAGLKLVSDQDLANSFEISFDYQDKNGVWKNMIVQREDRVGGPKVGTGTARLPSSYGLALGFRYYLLQIPVPPKSWLVDCKIADVYNIKTDLWNHEVEVSKLEKKKEPPAKLGTVVTDAVRHAQVKAVNPVAVPAVMVRDAGPCDCCWMQDLTTCYIYPKGQKIPGCKRCQEYGVPCTRSFRMRDPGSPLMRILARPSKNDPPPVFTTYKIAPRSASIEMDF